MTPEQQEIFDRAEKERLAKLRQTCISRLIELKRAGSNLLAGSFVACRGEVQLDLTIADADNYRMCYCFYGKMWHFTVSKAEIDNA